MAPTDSCAGLAAFPPELITRALEQAVRDADLTAHILTHVGLGPPPGEVRHLPATFLLELGAACRLLAWEVAGLTFHCQAGLPSARDALRDAFRDAAARAADPSAPDPGPALSRAVFALTVDRLAWTGPAYLRAEVLLDTPDEDALVEAMARFLWDHRHRPSAIELRGTP
jgi:hypothetical protein